ncbi:hypothetical protein P6F26_08395 [Roseibacterium sp. SDUM158017]|uniref:hypothetical protein n=1 Tax=Roseicyclus salinarum TaxID=3036773 RepID=UPI002414ED6A|nr:hypothetical protein [Roseibacterium sp. SDUM158017]MDG4648463.1 hypothetical protein [Roseibacterium sp. SDUM158017]
MQLRHLLPAAALAAMPAHAQEAVLEVFVQDGSAFDLILVRHAGGCDAVSGRLTVDFGPSQGRVVIDTEYGGGGTLHPAEVRVTSGPAEVAPVPDGARALDIALIALAPEGEVVLTLDIDSEREAGGQRRIVATAHDIEGAVVRFVAQGQQGQDGQAAQAVFGDAGAAILLVPCVPPGLVALEVADRAAS